MAEHSEREASQEIEISVAPISGPSLRRQVNDREDNAARSGFQSPTFNINDPRSKQLATRLRTRLQRRVAAAPSNPPAGHNRPAEQRPESARSPSNHKSTEPTFAHSIVDRRAPVEDAAGSQLGDNDDVLVNDDASDQGEAAFENMVFNTERITSSIATKRSEQAAESNKENEPQLVPDIRRKEKRRLIDPQEGARALSFDSQEQVVNSQVEVPDPTQDQGFQVSRNTARLQSSGVGHRRNRRVTANLPERGPSPPKRRRTHKNRQQNQERATSTSTPLRERQPSAQSDVYAIINATAKARNATVPKPTQTRTPWSTEETDVLYDLIQDFGPKWARLKKEDTNGVLAERDQVALKDKARNMKLDYLKAGRVLPLNFEAIAISALQIEKLRDLGIEYDRVTGHRVDGIFNDEEDED